VTNGQLALKKPCEKVRNKKEVEDENIAGMGKNEIEGLLTNRFIREES